MRPLVVRCGGLGEIVLLTALLSQLQARLRMQIDVISSGPWTRPLLQGHSAVGEIFVMGSRNAPYALSRSQQRLVQWLRERGAGPTWYCDANLAVRRLLDRARIPDDYIVDARSLAGVAGEHLVDRWIRFANLTPPAFQALLPQVGTRVASAAGLQLAPTSALALDKWLELRGLAGAPFIAVQAGNKRSMRGVLRRRPTNTKYWPEVHWAQVIRALHDLHPDHAILLLGVRRERRLNAKIARIAAIPGTHNVAGDVPISILLPLLQRAAGLVAVDTGPAHAAAALGCPTVALFGTADPTLYRPGGVETPAITLTGVLHGKPSMLGISSEAVIAAWTTLRRECKRGR
jgi:heptosyltransferase-2/heptosyltransferase-3